VGLIFRIRNEVRREFRTGGSGPEPHRDAYLRKQPFGIQRTEARGRRCATRARWLRNCGPQATVLDRRRWPELVPRCWTARAHPRSAGQWSSAQVVAPGSKLGRSNFYGTEAREEACVSTCRDQYAASRHDVWEPPVLQNRTSGNLAWPWAAT